MLAGDDPFLHQGLQTPPLLLGVLVFGAGAGDRLGAGPGQHEGELGPGLLDPRLLLADLQVHQVGLQGDDRLAGHHARALVDVNGRDPAADERPHLDVAGLDRAGQHEALVALSELEGPERAGGDEQEDDGQDDLALHDARFCGALRAPRLQMSRTVSM